MTDDANQPAQLRAEYEALAERNWNAIQEIHRAYDRFSRQAKWLLALLFIIQIATGIGIYVALSNIGSLTHRVARNQRATTSALCALRGDLEQRIKGADDYLKTHPQGFPGVPAAAIRQSIDGQRRTIKALSPIPCPK